MTTSRILACYQTRKTPDFAPIQQFAMDTLEYVATELIEGLRSGEIVLDRNSQVQKAEVFRNFTAISKARLLEHKFGLAVQKVFGRRFY